MTVLVNGVDLTVAEVVAVARGGEQVAFPEDAAFWERIEASRALNQRMVDAGQPIYGVTTGLGESSNRQLAPEKALQLQRSLIDHLTVGAGDVLPAPQARAVVLARLNALAKGYSAVRPELLRLLAALLNRDIVPRIPQLGSVGASGDLIPSAYIAGVLTGAREVWHRGEVVTAAAAFAAEGLEPLELQPKEGLALVNGTPFMTGIAALAVHDAEVLAGQADLCTALATEVLGGITDAFAPFVGETKPHIGQVRSAARIFALLTGSALASSQADTVNSVDGAPAATVRMQDRYSIRCAPQFIGALYEATAWARGIVEVELNSSNDNPLYDIDGGRVYNAGNFAGSHIALVMDTLKNALASVADLLDRQIALIVDAKYSEGLPHNLCAPLPADDPLAGTQHGPRALQLLASAITAEALNLTMPLLAFSRSTSAHNQDKVSMGATASRRTYEIVGLVRKVAAAHLVLLCQAADLRGPSQLGGTRAAYDTVRSVSAFVDVDRPLDTDLVAVEELLSGEQV